MIQDCELIGKALGEFMDHKRERCPRLYFLSNEELVDIFGIEKLVAASRSSLDAPKRTFISNLFEGVLTLHFRENDNAILGLTSKDHEVLSFLKPVMTDRDPPDVWLNHLDAQIAYTLRFNLLLAFSSLSKEAEFAEWVRMWPSQCLITAIQIWFTHRVESLLKAHQGRVKQERDQLEAEILMEYGFEEDAHPVQGS